MLLFVPLAQATKPPAPTCPVGKNSETCAEDPANCFGNTNCKKNTGTCLNSAQAGQPSCENQDCVYPSIQTAACVAMRVHSRLSAPSWPARHAFRLTHVSDASPLRTLSQLCKQE
jgi:hypothetical protein